MTDRVERAAVAAGLPRLAWAGRLGVGLYFLVAAFFKALNPAGFARQIESYGWPLPAGPLAMAFLFLTLEFLLGAALVLGARPRLAAAGTGVMLLLFIGVMAEAWYSGREVDCGCFGGAVEKGPGETALIDLLLLGLLVPTFLVARPAARRRWRAAAAAATAVLGVGLALAAPHLPVDSLVTKLVPGTDLEAMGIDALVPERGAVLVALLELEAEPCIAAVPGLNDILAAAPEVEVVGLAAATDDERAVFGWTTGAGFPVNEIGGSTLASLARELPRFALLVDGRVQAVWNERPPGPDALQAAMGGKAS